MTRIPADLLRRFVDPADAAAVPDDPDATRAAGGRHAAEHGRALERRAAPHHRRAEQRGFAIPRQVGPPPLGHDAHGPRYGRAPTDVLGAIRGPAGAPWRVLAVEFKSRPTRLSLADFAPHQAALLDALDAVGAVCLAAVELRDAGLWAVIPWGVLGARWRRERGGAYVLAADLADHEVVTDCYLARFAGGSP